MISSDVMYQTYEVESNDMKRFQHTKPVILLILLTAIIGLILVTGWQLRPLAREYCIRQGVLRNVSKTWWPESWKREIKVRKKLFDPVTLQFVEVPLSDVLDFLRDFTELQITVEKDVLNRMGFDESVPVSIHVQSATLRSSLRLLLDQIQLSYLIENGSLVITSRTEILERMTSVTGPATPGIGMESIRSNNEDHRREAAFAAAYDRPRVEVAVPQLITALRDEDKAVRIDAIFALGEIGHEAESAAPALEALLNNDDQPLRAMAIAALAKMGRLVFMDVLKGDDDPLTPFAAKYYKLLSLEVIEKAILRSVELLKSDDEQTRLTAIATLAAMHPHAKPSVAALNEVLNDSNARIRVAAARAIWKIDGAAPQAVPKLIELLKGLDSDVDRRTCMRRISNSEILSFFVSTGQEHVLDIPTMMDLLEDRDADVRCSSAKLLGKLGARATAATPALIKLLDQPQAKVRLDAATALLMIGSPYDRIVEELVDLLHDREEYVRPLAARLLGRIGTGAEAALPDLKQIANDTNEKRLMRETAAQVLLQIEDKLHAQAAVRPAQNQ